MKYRVNYKNYLYYEELYEDLVNGVKELEEYFSILDKKIDQKLYVNYYDKYLDFILSKPSDSNSINDNNIDYYKNLRDELKEFLHVIKKEALIVEVRGLSNEISELNDNAFSRFFNVNEYSSKIIRLIKALGRLNELNPSLALDELKEIYDNLFLELEILSFFDGAFDRVVNEVNIYNDKVLADQLKLRINDFGLEGLVIDSSTFSKCADIDSRINNLKSSYSNHVDNNENNTKDDYNTGLIECFDELLSKENLRGGEYKVQRGVLKGKQVLLRTILVPALIIPLSLPFLAFNLGKKASGKVLLTNTISKVFDYDTKKIVRENSSYEEMKIIPSATVVVCGDWRREIGDKKFVRTCDAYGSYDNSIKFDENNKVIFDSIDFNKLVKLYTYEEVKENVTSSEDLIDNQTLVQQTYQDYNDTTPSTKYNVPYTIVGSGAALVVGTSEVFIYLFGLKDYIDKIRRDIDGKVEIIDKKIENNEQKKQLIKEKKSSIIDL